MQSSTVMNATPPRFPAIPAASATSRCRRSDRRPCLTPSAVRRYDFERPLQQCADVRVPRRALSRAIPLPLGKCLARHRRSLLSRRFAEYVTALGTSSHSPASYSSALAAHQCRAATPGRQGGRRLNSSPLVSPEPCSVQEKSKDICIDGAPPQPSE